VSRWRNSPLTLVVSAEIADRWLGGGVRRPGDRALGVHQPAGRVAEYRRLAPAGVGRPPPAVGQEGMKPHDQRYAAASLAIASAASVKHVQRMSGHEDAAMTLNLYASLVEHDLDAASDRLEEAISRTVAAGVRSGARQWHSSDHWQSSERWQLNAFAVRPSGTLSHQVGALRAEPGNVAVPLAGFEPATHGLGNRCSIP